MHLIDDSSIVVSFIKPSTPTKMPKRKHKTSYSKSSSKTKMTSVISQHEDLEQYSSYWRNSRRFHKLIFATRVIKCLQIL